MPETDTTPMPEFERPPVVETVLSAQFEAIAGLSSAHFGLFWQRVRERLPRTESKPPLAQVFEDFGALPAAASRVQFEASNDSRPERVWFVDQAGSEMIQLQADRFIKNWRKSGDGDVYPRYEKVIRPAFERDFRTFQRFLSDESLGTVKVTQCEVTYVNHIIAGQGWESWSDAGKVFSFLGGLPPNVEDGAFLLRFPIFSQEQQVGRLVVEVQPAVRDRDGARMYVMNLTARGVLRESTDFFDLGREAVVSAFARLTTPAMHEVWGRQR